MRRLLSVLLILLFLPGLALGERLVCDVSAPVHAISDTLYGLFFEDINHAADGGLYAELLQNRSFENEDLNKPSAYQHLTGWQFNILAGSNGAVSLEDAAPLHENNPHYVRVQADGAGYAFQNLGYGSSAFRGGICVSPGERYDVSVWLRGEAADGCVEACLTNRAGVPLSDTVRFAPTDAWEKHSGVLTADCPQYPQVLLNVVVSHDRGVKEAIMASDALKTAVADEEKFLRGEGRILVRPSGTEALIRVMVEAKTESVAQLVAERLVKVIRSV